MILYALQKWILFNILIYQKSIVSRLFFIKYLDRLALFQYNSRSQKKSRRCKHEENLSTKQKKEI